jgi:asparagine synthase (glutamine-hydrolysing)
MLIPSIIGNHAMGERGGFFVRYDGGGRPPTIDVYGQWRDQECSRHHHRDSVLLVVGQCLLSPARLAAEFAAAAERVVDGLMGDLVVDLAIGWPGSCSIILLTPDGLVAYTDIAGQFPIYYSRHDDEILIGSEPGLLAAQHRRALDPVTAAAHIACPAVLPLWWGRSPYSGVERLEGGSVLKAESPRSLSVDSSHQPLPVPGRALSDGAGLLREALASAVRARCAGHVVSSDFSGGLDSTSIAFLAAAAAQRPVASVCYHQPDAPAADLAEATRFAQLEPRISLLVATGSRQTLPFAALTDPSWDAESARSGEPAPQALTSRAASLRLAVASSNGARLHLTGEGGDAVLLASPAYLARLAREHDARTFLRHCGGYARMRYASPAAIAGKALRLAGTSRLRALSLLAQELQRPTGRQPDWASQIAWWPPTGEPATWLTSRMRRELADMASDPETARGIADDAGPADLAALADLRRSGDAHRYLRQLGEPLGLAVHAPFLDTQVIKAALSVPAQTRADPRSYKPLLRAAMTGLVPAEVLSRRTKGDYSAEDYRGAREAAAALRGLLRDSRLADMGVVEPGAMDAVLDRMTAGVSVPLGPVNMLLATETWLRTEAKVGVSI